MLLLTRYFFSFSSLSLLTLSPLPHTSPSATHLRPPEIATIIGAPPNYPIFIPFSSSRPPLPDFTLKNLHNTPQIRRSSLGQNPSRRSPLQIHGAPGAFSTYHQ